MPTAPLSQRRGPRTGHHFNEVLYSDVLPPVGSSESQRASIARSPAAKRTEVARAAKKRPACSVPRRAAQLQAEWQDAFDAQGRMKLASDVLSTHVPSTAGDSQHSPYPRRLQTAPSTTGRAAAPAYGEASAKLPAAKLQGAEMRAAAASKVAAAAAQRAMQIRAAVGNGSGPRQPQQAVPQAFPAWPSASPSRASTAASMYSTVTTISRGPSPFRPVVLFTRLPLLLVFRFASWLLPAEVARMILAHASLARSRSELARWVALETYGVDTEVLRALHRLTSAGKEKLLPALKLLPFLHQRAEAIARARGQAVAAGLRHSLVIARGSNASGDSTAAVAYSFGAASSGQLGRGSPAEQYSPVPTSIPLARPVASVACGGDHSLLVSPCGVVWAFGRNADGQLGIGHDKDVVRPVTMPVPPATQASCGADHSLVLAADGGVWACGRGAEGQLGVELATDSQRTLRPLRSHEAPADVQLIACGADHSVVLDSAGRAFSFGENSKGQLGIGNYISQHRPQRMLLPPGVLAVDVACGGTHSLIVAGDMRIFGCGGNDQGQLGIGGHQDHLMPDLVLGRAPNVVCRAQRVSCGFSHSLLLTATGAVWVLGGRNPCCAEAPVHGVPWRVREIAAGGGHALCVAGEAVFSFGVGSSGQLGDGSERPHSPTPRRVVIGP
eukprot:gnl/TRDRNA2_/TRDRNA2_172473_c0_seq1.p1 gnl/TRDRNA2_/TRDRNA2_172473_c0~~gnl/TRDRNA2_/TRDRNA2_172473_c0_seq1.p1  ORF type:complete len:670 (-),score=84.36 gnl/TRDRNA2_/TRDRNA2_172473_c0_seq1:79-2088(-)